MGGAGCRADYGTQGSAHPPPSGVKVARLVPLLERPSWWVAVTWLGLLKAPFNDYGEEIELEGPTGISGQRRLDRHNTHRLRRVGDFAFAHRA